MIYDNDVDEPSFLLIVSIVGFSEETNSTLPNYSIGCFLINVFSGRTTLEESILGHI